MASKLGGAMSKVIREFLHYYHDLLTAELNALDGQAKFVEDAWQKPGLGFGRTRVMKDGALFEQAGVSFSDISGNKIPQSLLGQYPDLAGEQYWGAGVSMVLHPKNPYCPTAHLNFRYFPYFIAEGISQVRTASELENPPISFASRPNILSCANRVIRPHRLYTFYRLSQYSKLRQAAVSFTRLANRIQGHDVMINLMDFEEMCAVAEQHHFHSDEFRAWLAEVFPRLPISIEDFDVSDNKSDNWVNSRAFSGSYANIVTETELVSFVPTEKVVKSMLAGCLIYMVGSDLFMTKLQRMGFDLNFQGIDYEKYDHYQHWQLRINTVLEMVNDAYDDLPEIWLLNRARLEHNRNLFFSQQLVDHVISDVTDIFKLC